jgi:hypothetical protein
MRSLICQRCHFSLLRLLNTLRQPSIGHRFSMIVLMATICFDGFGGSVFEDQVDRFSVDKVT